MTVRGWSDLDVAIDLHAELGEGPRWDHRSGVLAWVDILGGLVHLTDPATGVTTSIPVGSAVGAIALWGETGYLLALKDAFATLDRDAVEVTNRLELPKGQRMNDGALDPIGRFLAGSITDDRSPTGALYVRDVDGTVRTLLEGVTVSNGLAWSATGDRLFYVDSPRQSIDVMDYDLETGSVARRRRWVEIPEGDGIPDGLTIDDEGCLWLALWGGAKVRRYSVDGEVIGEVDLPVSRPTSCAFGGPELDRLFITTASVGSTPDDPPRALDGALFTVETGCTGVTSVVSGARA
jgi:sugar lactone lactonase YvrE